MMADNPKKKTDRRPIVCGTDFSATAIEAMNIAAAMARRLGTKLVVVHVDEPFGLAAGVPRLFESDVVQSRGKLDQEAARVQRLGTDVKGKLLSGSAFDELVNVTIKSKARLVVVGAVGHGLPRRLLVGSVAERTAEVSPVPTLVVRPGSRLTSWIRGEHVLMTIRPIRPEDEPLMVEFHKTLSDRSVYLRYFGIVSLEKRIMHERLRRVCFIDYDREIVLVIDLKSRNGIHQILGVGRLIKEHGTDEAEFAILISDPWQGKGLGSELLKLLVAIGRKERLRRITGVISGENVTMRQVSEEVGFHLHFDEAAGEWQAELVL
jgi:nucleotide-binding universal stress UspA family protein/RimJ/RimL family protein N-acetyltransferase